MFIILLSVSIGWIIVMIINNIIVVIDMISIGLKIFNEILMSVLNFLFWLLVEWFNICCSFFECLFDVIMCIIMGGKILVLLSVVCRLLFFFILIVVLLICFLIYIFCSILVDICMDLSNGIVLVVKILSVCVKWVVFKFWVIFFIKGNLSIKWW